MMELCEPKKKAGLTSWTGFKCDHCDFCASTGAGLGKHMVVEHGLPPCHTQQFQFKTEQEFLDWIDMKHNAGEAYVVGRGDRFVCCQSSNTKNRSSKHGTGQHKHQVSKKMDKCDCMSYYTVDRKDFGDIHAKYQGVHNDHALVPGAHGISPGTTREVDRLLGDNYTPDQIVDYLMATGYDQRAFNRKFVTNRVMRRKDNTSHAQQVVDVFTGDRDGYGIHGLDNDSIGTNENVVRQKRKLVSNSDDDCPLKKRWPC